MKTLLTIGALLVSFQSFCQGQFQGETAGSITFASGQVMKLAEAIPADKYTWTPQARVRTVGQVCAHIISANYFFATKLGAKLPAGVNMETLEADLKTKDALAIELKRSYDLIISTVKNLPDASLKSKVEFPFPGEYTSMSASLIALAHTNEHLGQLIAYARMNNITPPWNEGN